MITVYHRPASLQEALQLLSRPNTRPLGGGTLLAGLKDQAVEVVDLQAIGLNALKQNGNQLEVGATATLQQWLEDEHCPPALVPAIKLEAPLNIRNAATVAGTLVACDGRSTLATALLAIDAKLSMIVDQKPGTMNLGGFLPLRRPGLITAISISTQIKFRFEQVARSPTDKAVVCVAVAAWPSGRTRLALGGYGKAPLLAMDGTEAAGVEAAARNAFHDATDEWASAAYRMDAAATLARRCALD
jgi:CO/xanthine dehydrogenase FAD-binding subunit